MPTMPESEMKTAGKLLRKMQDAICTAEPGPGRDALQARFDHMVARFRALPERVSSQWPFADTDEFKTVYRTELEWALDGWYEA
jgi:hypothetical protein